MRALLGMPSLSDEDKEAFLKEVGAKLRVWREKNGLTRVDIRMQANFSDRTIARWEEGEAPGMRIEHLVALEKIAPGLIKAIFPQFGENL